MMSGRKKRRGREFAPLELRKAFIARSEMRRKYQKKYLRATSSNRPSDAIKVKCLECVGWKREEAVNCPILHCVSWPYRPGTSANRRGGPGSDSSNSVPTPTLEANLPKQGEGGGSGDER